MYSEKAILFITASCFLNAALAAPEHGLKVNKHKASTVTYDGEAVESYVSGGGSTTSNPLDGDNSELEKRYRALKGQPAGNVEEFGLPLSSNVPFPPDVPTSTASNWKKVGYLDMSDPTQQCPPSWTKIPRPRASCGKKTGASCDSLAIGTSGTSYQTVCGRFRAYQVGSVDAFGRCGGPVTPNTIEFPYVDGISITYGSPGSRQHIFTYAAGLFESADVQFKYCNCPCAQGRTSPSFIGSDYYCESGNPDNNWVGDKFYPQDVLFDGQQCTALEATCCNLPNLPWFCKTLPTPISGDLEVRICTDELIDNENVALEFFELYIK